MKQIGNSYSSKTKKNNTSKTSSKATVLTRKKTLEEEKTVLWDGSEKEREMIILELAYFSIAHFEPKLYPRKLRFPYNWSRQDTLEEKDLKQKTPEEQQIQRMEDEKRRKIEAEELRRKKILENKWFLNIHEKEIKNLPGFDDNASYEPEEEPSMAEFDDQDAVGLDMRIKEYLEMDYDVHSHIRNPPQIPLENLFFEAFEKMGKFSVFPPKVVYEAKKRVDQEIKMKNKVKRPPMKIPKYWMLRSKVPGVQVKTFYSLQPLTDQTDQELDVLGIKVSDNILRSYKGSKGDIIGSLNQTNNSWAKWANIQVKSPEIDLKQKQVKSENLSLLNSPIKTPEPNVNRLKGILDKGSRN